MKNFHVFEIQGVNQEKFFNLVSKSYKIFDVQRFEKNHSSFKVKLRDKKSVRNLILDNNFKILSEKSCGPVFLLSKFFASYGLIIGILFCFTFSVLQFNMVKKIEVWGECDEQAVSKFVADNLNSKFKNQLDCRQIELLIKNNFEDFSFVSVAVIGQTLVVNVKTSISPPEMDGVFSPMVSEYDGVVREISLIQGTLCVNVGDIIQKGQILVEGFVINSEGEKMNIEPRAEILLDVWAEGESVHYQEKLITYRTGKTLTRTSVSLYGHEFYTNNVTSNFAQYETESFSKVLAKNNILPFIFTSTTYFETRTELVESSFADCQEQIINEARENCLQNLIEYEIIKNENYKIIERDKSTVVKYVITATVRLVE